MAKKDASKYLGGMSGKAASDLRSRKSKIDQAIDAAENGGAKNKKKASTVKSKKK